MPTPIPASASSARTRSRSGTRTTYRCQTCSLPGAARRPDDLVDAREQLVVARGARRGARRSSRAAASSLAFSTTACSVSSREFQPTDLVLVLHPAAVVAQEPDGLRDRVVVREHGARVAVGAEVLARVEARPGRDADRPGRATVLARALRLRRVLDHDDALVAAHRRRRPPPSGPSGRRGARARSPGCAG